MLFCRKTLNFSLFSLGLLSLIMHKMKQLNKLLLVPLLKHLGMCVWMCMCMYVGKCVQLWVYMCACVCKYAGILCVCLCLCLWCGWLHASVCMWVVSVWENVCEYVSVWLCACEYACLWLCMWAYLSICAHVSMSVCFVYIWIYVSVSIMCESVYS